MKTRRSQKGNTVEFAGAFLVLISFVVVPLLTIGFVPIRFMLSHGVLSELTYRMSHCESRSEAYALMKQDRKWKEILAKCGVTVSKEQLSLVVTTGDGSSRMEISQGQDLPQEWLPGGSRGACIYSLELKTTCSIAPLFTGGAAVPGLTQPITMAVCTRSQWENLARDPKSTRYFLNQ